MTGSYTHTAVAPATAGQNCDAYAAAAASAAAVITLKKEEILMGFLSSPLSLSLRWPPARPRGHQALRSERDSRRAHLSLYATHRHTRDMRGFFLLLWKYTRLTHPMPPAAAAATVIISCHSTTTSENMVEVEEGGDRTKNAF